MVIPQTQSKRPKNKDRSKKKLKSETITADGKVDSQTELKSGETISKDEVTNVEITDINITDAGHQEYVGENLKQILPGPSSAVSQMKMPCSPLKAAENENDYNNTTRVNLAEEPTEPDSKSEAKTVEVR